jgi:hypothetical protein
MPKQEGLGGSEVERCKLRPRQYMHRALWRRHRTPLAAHLHSLAMASSTDSIQATLFARPLPPLEPGKTVYDRDLVKQISAQMRMVYIVVGEMQRCHQRSVQGVPSEEAVPAITKRCSRARLGRGEWWFSVCSVIPLHRSTRLTLRTPRPTCSTRRCIVVKVSLG